MPKCKEKVGNKCYNWKYKGYNIFRKGKRFEVKSYAGDFKPKIVKSLKDAEKFINKKLGVD